VAISAILFEQKSKRKCSLRILYDTTPASWILRWSAFLTPMAASVESAGLQGSHRENNGPIIEWPSITKATEAHGWNTKMRRLTGLRPRFQILVNRTISSRCRCRQTGNRPPERGFFVDCSTGWSDCDQLENLQRMPSSLQNHSIRVFLVQGMLNRGHLPPNRGVNYRRLGPCL